VKITLPELSLVALIGPSGCGKSSFARKHFKPTEILSSDFCRGLISDDENNQAATNDAFETLHFIARKRLARGLLTVIDATNVQRSARRRLVAIAEQHSAPAAAIVFNLPLAMCLARNQSRPDRQVGSEVVEKQTADLLDSLPKLSEEGFRYVYVMDNAEDIDSVSIRRKEF